MTYKAAQYLAVFLEFFGHLDRTGFLTRPGRPGFAAAYRRNRIPLRSGSHFKGGRCFRHFLCPGLRRHCAHVANGAGNVAFVKHVLCHDHVPFLARSHTEDAIAAALSDGLPSLTKNGIARFIKASNDSFCFGFGIGIVNPFAFQFIES